MFNSVHFVTFGEGNALIRSASQRLKTQAEETGWFSTARAYGLASLMQFPSWYNDHHEFLFHSKKGFGYWIWKPFLIWQTLQNTRLNDYVLYLDAGYEFCQEGEKRFFEYLQLASENLILAWSLPTHINRKWIKSSVLDYFGITNDSYILSESIREAGFCLIKNTSLTRSFFREFSLICCDHKYYLVDDSFDPAQQHRDFREHRHDQSIFSLLSYERQMGVFPINESYFEDEWKLGYHPAEFPFAAFRNRSGFRRFSLPNRVGAYKPGYFTAIESNIQSSGYFWGDNVISLDKLSAS